MAKLLWLLYITIVAVTLPSSYGAQAKKESVGIFELRKGNLSVKFTNYGAHMISVVYPDKYGKLDDVILGYDTVQEYMQDTQSLGATLGRVANRISNARFTLNGTVYKLYPNEGNNTLHSGLKRFSKVVWKVKTYLPKSHVPRLILRYHSYDGEGGFPGDLRVTVSYALLDGNKLSITMKAKALNKATPVNIVQHPYWNLGGQASGDILSEELQIFASSYTEMDSHLIPTGKILPVKNTPYDFTKPATVGSRIGMLPNGYDLNYVLGGDGRSKNLKLAAIVHDKKTGRGLEMLTNQPGMQLYSSNFLTQKGKGGFLYKPHYALCLETQGYPDSVNHPTFPSQIVYPGQTYVHYMLIKLYAR